MKTILFLFLLITLFSGCNKQQEDKPRPVINISGSYSGIIPCADCQGIYYALTLKADSTYMDKTVYLGKDVEPSVSMGKWAFTDSNKIKLYGDGGVQQLLYSGGNLTMLDGEGKINEGPLADKFILRSGVMKMPEVAGDSGKSSSENSIHIPWTLSEINGQKVDEKNYTNGIPNIYIKRMEKKFTGSTGCNRINGEAIISGDSISFSKFITTRMACPGTGESEFITALTSVDSYKVNNGTLSLMSKGKTVMKFSK